VLALLPEYAGLEDPVAELRAACLAAAGWLGREIVVLADEQGGRVAQSLLSGAGVSTGSTAGASYLIVGNGSATRSEKAPGHLDDRAAGFDAALGASLRAGRPDVDLDLARELWADVDGIARMRDLGDLGAAQVDYDGDPFGVQYWVMRWEW
jgi:hypothetical protein